MTKFWELFERSIILQSTITLILLLAVIYMYLAGQEVAEELVQFTSLVLGFWFGSKIENAKTHEAVKRMQQKVE